jgi:hypothetical protein
MPYFDRVTRAPDRHAEAQTNAGVAMWFPQRSRGGTPGDAPPEPSFWLNRSLAIAHGFDAGQ